MAVLWYKQLPSHPSTQGDQPHLSFPISKLNVYLIQKQRVGTASFTEFCSFHDQNQKAVSTDRKTLLIAVFVTLQACQCHRFIKIQDAVQSYLRLTRGRLFFTVDATGRMEKRALFVCWENDARLVIKSVCAFFGKPCHIFLTTPPINLCKGKDRYVNCTGNRPNCDITTILRHTKRCRVKFGYQKQICSVYEVKTEKQKKKKIVFRYLPFCIIFLIQALL